MSEVSSRPRVRSIECAHGPAIGSALGALLAVGVATLIVETRRAFRQYSRAVPPVKTKSIDALPALAEKRNRLEQKFLGELQASTTLAPAEALKIAMLASLQASPYAVSGTALEQPLRAFARAQSLDETRQAQQALLHQLDRAHREALQQSLALACKKASIKVGFTAVQVMPGLNDALRVTASDARGRSLISEINPGDSHRDPSIATEVIGVSDGSCVAILDSFDKAIEEEGVRSEAPDRKYTGGVCELAATREFVQRKLQLRSNNWERHTMESPAANYGRKDEPRRSQRLNEAVRIRQK